MEKFNQEMFFFFFSSAPRLHFHQINFHHTYHHMLLVLNDMAMIGEGGDSTTYPCSIPL